MKKIYTVIIIILLVGILFLGFISNYASNLISEIYHGNEYFIPSESNYYDFVVTESNDGSGEWWAYAEDKDSYYHLVTYEPQLYDRILKEDATKCIGFDSKDITTWCDNK